MDSSNIFLFKQPETVHATTVDKLVIEKDDTPLLVLSATLLRNGTELVEFSGENACNFPLTYLDTELSAQTEYRYSAHVTYIPDTNTFKQNTSSTQHTDQFNGTNNYSEDRTLNLLSNANADTVWNVFNTTEVICENCPILQMSFINPVELKGMLVKRLNKERFKNFTLYAGNDFNTLVNVYEYSNENSLANEEDIFFNKVILARCLKIEFTSTYGDYFSTGQIQFY